MWFKRRGCAGLWVLLILVGCDQRPKVVNGADAENPAPKKITEIPEISTPKLDEIETRLRALDLRFRQEPIPQPPVPPGARPPVFLESHRWQLLTPAQSLDPRREMELLQTFVTEITGNRNYDQVEEIQRKKAAAELRYTQLQAIYSAEKLERWEADQGVRLINLRAEIAQKTSALLARKAEADAAIQALHQHVAFMKSRNMGIILEQAGETFQIRVECRQDIDTLSKLRIFDDHFQLLSRALAYEDELGDMTAREFTVAQQAIFIALIDEWNQVSQQLVEAAESKNATLGFKLGVIAAGEVTAEEFTFISDVSFLNNFKGPWSGAELIQSLRSYLEVLTEVVSRFNFQRLKQAVVNAESADNFQWSWPAVIARGKIEYVSALLPALKPGDSQVEMEKILQETNLESVSRRLQQAEVWLETVGIKFDIMPGNRVTARSDFFALLEARSVSAIERSQITARLARYCSTANLVAGWLSDKTPGGSVEIDTIKQKSQIVGDILQDLTRRGVVTGGF